jgi:hypothetical protein
MCGPATLPCFPEAASDKRLFYPISKNASAQAGDDVLFAEGFDMRQRLPAVDTISVLIR